MDTRLKEEFLTCIVCQEVFRDPVTLHCGHTFCIQCVTAFTKTQTEAKENESLPCPHCRGLTKVPDPTKPVEEWARQIRTGFFVKGLVDTFLGNGAAENAQCSHCKEEGETKPATVWCPNCEKVLCSQCEKSHCKFLPSHKVSSITNTGQGRQDTIQRMCEDHPDTAVDMFCQTCDVAACPRCCLLHHKSCVESIKPLTEVMPRITSALEERAKKLTSEINRLERHIPRRKTQISNVASSNDKVEADIDDFGDRLARLVKGHLRKKFEDAKEKALQGLQEDVTSTEAQHQIASQTLGLLQSILRSSSDISRYDMYNLYSKQTKPKDHVSHVSEISVFDNMEMISSKIALLQLGDINEVYDPKERIEDSIKATLVEKMDTQIEDELPNIFDIVVANAGNMKVILTTDIKSNMLKAFYKTEGNIRKSFLRFKGKPYNITTISDNKGAVAVLDTCEIVIFRILPDLELVKVINTSFSYVGLTTIPSGNCFVASWYSDDFFKTGIHFMDLSCTVSQTVSTSELKRPSFITAQSDTSILVSDRNVKCVMSVSNKGVVSTYESLSKEVKLPRGIVKTTTGECFVVDQTSNRVLCFNENGDTWKAVLTADDGLDEPCGLFVDDRNYMYVSVSDRFIHVYSFAS